ncbi:MAG TPA: hypothetical protein PKJ26_05045 [Candidatus Woesebacteria bacterium]|nr:hypothetical protein [Candidatus Woesebacteria bacterium]HNS65833.1 hypothetical protein [Candidatus Woesebacteria bacterium]
MNHSSVSLTIHNLDPVLYRVLKQKADTTDVSLNRLIKTLLTQSLGLNKTTKVSDFSEFSKQWTREELKQFQQTQAQFSTVDATDWQ